jgi:hypothetical protein
MQTEVLPPCVKRWSADEYPYPSSPSPKRAEPVRPGNLRATVVDGLRGHVTGPSTVRSDSGREYRALVPRALRPGDRVAFAIAVDSESGSRLTLARNVELATLETE